MKKNKSNVIFKDIKGYEGLYKISTHGDIISAYTGQMRTLYIGNKGYYRADLSKNNKRKSYEIHRLVALTFIPNPENKPTVNHIDGNKLNNNVDNLEWATYHENNSHAWRMGLKGKGSQKTELSQQTPVIKRERKYNRFRTSRAVYQLDLNNNIIRRWDGVKYAAQELGIDKSGLWGCLRGRYKTTAGFMWRYAETQNPYGINLERLECWDSLTKPEGKE